MAKNKTTRHALAFKFLCSIFFCVSVFISCFTLTACSGEQGPKGDDGKNGATWYSGTENPTIEAQVGDFYFETDTNNIWRYENTGWNIVFNLSGPQGDVGETGPNGKDGAKWFTGTEITGTENSIEAIITGAVVGDLYLNVDTKCLYACISENTWKYVSILKNVQTLSLSSDELCDYYYINSSTGVAVANNNYSATSYIDCEDAVSIELTTVQSSTANIGIAFYDKNKVYISGFANKTGEKSSVDRNIAVPENAKYFKTSFFKHSDIKTYGGFSCDIVYPITKELNQYRNYQDEFIYFSQQVNQSLDEKNTSNYKATTGVLALPKNYSATGKATPLIIYAHGLSHYVYYGKWGNSETFVKQKQNFTEQGFAVLGCNGARDNNKTGRFPSAGAPQFARAYKQCLDYVLENYNIDANSVFIVGGSAGGPTAIDFALTYKESVKGMVLISTWIDIKECAWGQNIRNNFVEYLGFENTTTYETAKAAPYNPYLLIKTNVQNQKYLDAFDIPVYGIYGSTETNFMPKFKEFMNAVIKGNDKESKLFEIAGHGHEIVSGAIEEVDNKICNLFSALINK